MMMLLGGDREMDVIDVAKQNNVRMTLREFVEYYNDPYRNRILNVISLEFTNTGYIIICNCIITFLIYLYIF